MRVGLLPMGPVPAELLSWLSDALASYGVVCDLRPPTPLPQVAFNPRRAQYDADAILAELRATPRWDVDLAVTREDLVSGALNFVFGLASADDRLAIVSLNRLDTGNGGDLRQRLLKEAVHELGHVLGLPHCANPGCVMQFSNSLADTDAKAATFCGGCRDRVPGLRSPGSR